MTRRALPAPPGDPPRLDPDLDLDLPGRAGRRPRARSWASAALLLLARAVLWSLVSLGALRGLAVPHPAARDGPQVDRDLAAGVAAAFAREYLTVGDDRAGRARRLGDLAAAGVDLRGAVSLPAATSQYADLVEVIGVRRDRDRTEVTVLAHLVELRATGYRDGGTLALAVPVAAGPAGVAVVDLPRPARLPVDRSLRPPAPGLSGGSPAGVAARAATRLARRAVAAMLAGDTATLAGLGDGTAPATNPLPEGWRGLRVEDATLSGPARAPLVTVLVRAAAPGGPARFLVPVRVSLSTVRGGLAVRRVDAGGP